MSKGLHSSPAWLALILVAAFHGAWAADPGDAWLTDSAAPPEEVQWLASESLCHLVQGKLPQALRALGSKPFLLLTAESQVAYAGASCKGKYGQFPYLVRAVSTAGQGRLDAGLLQGELWLRFAGMGGQYPFEKTPVVLWLYGPPTQVHVIASIVE